MAHLSNTHYEINNVNFSHHVATDGIFSIRCCLRWTLREKLKFSIKLKTFQSHMKTLQPSRQILG